MKSDDYSSTYCSRDAALSEACILRWLSRLQVYVIVSRMILERNGFVQRYIVHHAAS